MPELWYTSPSFEVPAGALVIFSDGRVGTVPPGTTATATNMLWRDGWTDVNVERQLGTGRGTMFSLVDAEGLTLGLGSLTLEDGTPVVVDVTPAAWDMPTETQ